MKRILFLAVALAVLTGCKQIEYVPVIEHRTDTVRIMQQQRDSIWLHDSIKVTEKGDTIRIEKWHTKYVESIRHDTLYQATHDTIPQPYPVTQYVEKPLSKIQKAFIGIGILSLMVVIICVVWKLRKFLP